MRLSNVRIAACAMAVIGVGCSSGSYRDVAREPGSPLPGLSEGELARFRQGEALFNRPFTPEDGLGPLYNQDRCSSCHGISIAAGPGVEWEERATRFVPPDSCDLLHAEGGDNIQQRATPLLRAQGISSEKTPPSATTRTVVTPPSLWGLGLIEAIPDETILALEDPDDTDGDGISGRAGRTADGRLGRFRRKTDQASLTDIAAAAFSSEIGVTTPSFPFEQTVNGVPVPPESDPTPDPELDRPSVELVADYVRFLAPRFPMLQRRRPPATRWKRARSSST